MEKLLSTMLSGVNLLSSFSNNWLKANFIRDQAEEDLEYPAIVTEIRSKKD